MSLSSFPTDDALSGVFPWQVGGAPPPFIPASPVENVHKPLADLRSYRFIKLPNGVRALLMSDPRAEKAAAALTVGVGHLSDPRELPGLSHFLEHMLFLGTTPFPDESSYKAFLKDRGGSSNATTAAEQTTYHFTVNHAHLPEALARFCAFFTAPLFTESATERELNAVDSENARNLSLDGRREFQVGKHLAHAGSVWRKFGTGNLATLRPAGVDVRSALLAHHAKYYDAGVMTLAVLGREPLDELERVITGRAVGDTGVPSNFGAIRTAGAPAALPLHDGAPPEAHKHPYQRAQLARTVFLAPVKDVRSLCVTWPIATSAFPDWTGAHRVAAHLLGHEGAGSVTALLKARAWANSLGASADRRRHFASFSVDVSLTPDGLAHVDDIVRLLLQAVALIRGQSDAALAAVYAELAQVTANSVRFRSEVPPNAAVQGAAAALQQLPGVDALVGSLLPAAPFDAAPLRSLLDCLAAPSNMLVFVTSRDFSPPHAAGAAAPALVAAHGAALRADTEPYYGFDYWTASFTPQQLAHWGAGAAAAADVGGAAAAGGAAPPASTASALSAAAMAAAGMGAAGARGGTATCPKAARGTIASGSATARCTSRMT